MDAQDADMEASMKATTLQDNKSQEEIDRLEREAEDYEKQVRENIESGNIPEVVDETGTAGVGEENEEGQKTVGDELDVDELVQEETGKDTPLAQKTGEGVPLAPQSDPNPLQKQALDDSEKTVEDVIKKTPGEIGGEVANMGGGRKRKQSKKKKRRGKRKSKKKRN